MVLDISGIGYLMPLYGFLIVFIVVYALLMKTKLLGGVMWIDLIIAIIIAAIFSTFASAQTYVQNIVPWFAVILIILFLILALIGMGGKITDIFKPGFLWIFIIVLILAFIFAAVKVFPSSFGSAWNSLADFAKTKAKIFGAIVLIVIAVIVGWIIVKK